MSDLERRRNCTPIGDLKLCRPTYELVASFVQMRDAFLAVGENEWNIRGEEVAHTDPYAYVDLMNDRSQGRNVADGFVSADEFWIVDAGVVVGSLSVRPQLNESLRQLGGHVGYSTHPAYRGRGIATFALRSALGRLDDIGVAEALVTCRADNAASMTVIERCGGRRIADVELPEYPDRTRRRYLVPTRGAAGVETLTRGQAAVEENMLEFFRECARVTPGVKLHDGDDLFWSLTSVPFPVFNSLHRTRASSAKLPAMIEAAQARSRANSVPIAWFVGPGSLPVDLGATLERHGFKHEGSTPGMVADLTALPEGIGMPSNLKIERVADEESARIWCDVLCEGFELPPFIGAAHFALATRVGLEPDAGFHHYLAFWEGEPVATAMLFPAAGVAGIYNVTTLATARRRGIGSAVTRRALLDAKAAGLSTAVLQSSAAGLGVYESLGFVECLRYAMYLWDPAQVTRRG